MVVSIIISVVGFFLAVFLPALLLDSVSELRRLIYLTGKGLLRATVLLAWTVRALNVILAVSVAGIFALNKFAPAFLTRLSENWGVRIGFLFALLIILFTLINDFLKDRKNAPHPSLWTYAYKYIKTEAGSDFESRREMLLDEAIKVLRFTAIQSSQTQNKTEAQQNLQAQAQKSAQSLFEVFFKMGNDDKATDLVAEQVSREDSPVKLAAIEALSKCKDKGAIKPLLALLKDKDTSVSSAAAKSLSSLDYNSAEDSVRARIAVALEKWDEVIAIGAAAVEPLIEVLRDEKSRARAKVVELLGRIGDARAVEPLVAALDDNDEQVRREALWALGRKKDSRVLGGLIKELGGGSAQDRAIEMIVGFGSEAVEPLLWALSDDKREAKECAAEALGRIKDKRAVEPLSKLFRESHSLKVAQALAKIGDDRGIEFLASFLTNEQASAQEAAATALALVEAARPDVRDLLNQRREQRRKEEELLEKKKAEEQAEREKRALLEAIELREKIRIGMSLSEVIALLGPPAQQFGGDDLRRKLEEKLGGISGLSRAISMASERQYYVWRRPEGEWQLAFVNNRLDKIQSAP